MTLSSSLAAEYFKGFHFPGGSYIFEIMLHLLHVKQMYTKLTLQAHEFILGVQIAREMEDFIGDSTVKSPTQIFFDLQMYLPYRIWPFSWLHTVKLIQVVFRGTALKQLQSPGHNPDFPRACTP